MSTNLMNVFKPAELRKVGTAAIHVVSLAYSTNKRTGAKIARAVLDDGRTLIKTVTATGVVSETIIKIPEILSVAQRNSVIKDLYKQGHTQEVIAAMLNISQATVSKTLRKK
ncbi:MAG: Trp family transcriptional regulator [Clostridiales bacterium]|nr:Trp family transcriptional regulator [Clostridiales bacterium]